MILLILQSVSHTGKTTFAKEFVNGKKDWIRVSLDDLRNMKNQFWMFNQEKYIKDVELFLVKHALISGFNVVVDACNIRRKTVLKWVNLSKEINDTVLEFKKFDYIYAK
jgi:predicted kinase